MKKYDLRINTKNKIDRMATGFFEHCADLSMCGFDPDKYTEIEKNGIIYRYSKNDYANKKMIFDSFFDSLK